MRSRLVAAALAIAVSGCSFAFTPPARLAPPKPHCSTSRELPGVDTAIATLGAVVALLGLGVLVDTLRNDQPGDWSDLGYGVGAIVSIPGLLILTSWGSSAGFGFRSARRCEAAHARAREVERELSSPGGRCRAAFQAIADGLFLDVTMPVMCTIEDAAVPWPALLVEDEAALADHPHLGVRTSPGAGAGAWVRVWTNHDRVAAVEIVSPSLPRPWPQLRHELGAPDARMPYHVGDHDWPDGQWVYSRRGLAVIDSGDSVDRLLLFTPTTVDDFRAHLALGLPP